MAYQDSGADYKSTIMRFNGEEWNIVGERGFSAGYVSFISLAIYNNAPYAAYQDYENSESK